MFSIAAHSALSLSSFSFHSDFCGGFLGGLNFRLSLCLFLGWDGVVLVGWGLLSCSRGSSLLGCS